MSSSSHQPPKKKFQFFQLPTEIRHLIYDSMETRLDPELEDGIVKNGSIPLTSENTHKVEAWLSKRTLELNILKRVSPDLQTDIEAYLTCPHPNLHDPPITFTWLDQLGELLLKIGHFGREKITALDLEWNQSVRCQHRQKEDLPLKIFALLADCPNLRYLKMTVDPFQLARHKVPWFWAGHRPEEPVRLFELESVKALREVRLGAGAVVELKYVNTTFSRYYNRNDTEPGFLEWLKEGMARPRAGQEEIMGRIRDLGLLDGREFLDGKEFSVGHNHQACRGS